jgi:hypothetical protein
MNDKEIDWNKVQTVDQLKTVVKLLVNVFGGNSKLTVNKSFFERANEETIKRVESICKEMK